MVDICLFYQPIFMLAEDRYTRFSVVILYTAYSFIRDITNPALCSKTRKIARPSNNRYESKEDETYI